MTEWYDIGTVDDVPPLGARTVRIGGHEIAVFRTAEGEVFALENRCPHKGVKVAAETCGNTGKFFRCPYHAWTFKTDGSLLSIPLKKGYENTGLECCEASGGMAAVQAGLAADAQAVAAEWPAWVAPKAAPAAAAAKPADRVFRLRGMIHGGDRPTAFLDDKVLLVGEEIDGYTLEEIAADHVVLVDPRGKRIELYPEAGP